MLTGRLSREVYMLIEQFRYTDGVIECVMVEMGVSCYLTREKKNVYIFLVSTGCTVHRSHVAPCNFTGPHSTGEHVDLSFFRFLISCRSMRDL